MYSGSLISCVFKSVSFSFLRFPVNLSESLHLENFSIFFVIVLRGKPHQLDLEKGWSPINQLIVFLLIFLPLRDFGIPDISRHSFLKYWALLQHCCYRLVHCIYFRREILTDLAMHRSDLSLEQFFQSSASSLLVSASAMYFFR